MTEDRLQELEDQYRTLGNLSTWIAVADKTPNVRKKLSALFEVIGYVSEETLNECYDLVRPELDEAHQILQRNWDNA